MALVIRSKRKQRKFEVKNEFRSYDRLGNGLALFLQTVNQQETPTNTSCVSHIKSKSRLQYIIAAWAPYIFKYFDSVENCGKI
jgi:hypothetical protein